MATTSSTLRATRSVHPTVAHTVDSLLLQERTKWATHIHDGLTQSVTSALLELQGLQQRIRTEPETVLAALHEIEDAIRGDLKEIREILFELEGGTPHTEPPLASFVHRTGGTVAPARPRLDRGRGGPDLGPHPRDRERRGRRGARQRGEARGLPRGVRADPRRAQDELRIEVEDRGVGIVGSGTDDDQHFGLRLMRGRAERVGGTIEIESKPGNGTTVVAVLPVGGRGDEG